MNRVYSLALIASLTMGTTSCKAESTEPTELADLIITNAVIYGHKSADTLAVYDGNIVYIGNENGVNSYRNGQTLVMDLEHAFVMPGFIDNHNHVFEAASSGGGNCELNMDASLAEQVPYLKACRKQANDNEWLMGYGFSIDAVLNEQNESTPLEVIDRIFPDHPVVIMEQTSHSMWVNSQALRLAGITKNSIEPQGGKILKDEETGELNGILFDNAGDLVMEMAWNSLENQFDTSYIGLMSGLEEAAAHGITTIGDGRLYWKRGWYEVWRAAEKNDELTARVSLRPWIYPTDSMDAQLKYLKTIHSGNKSGLLLVDQVKMYSDGIFINGTAKLLKPYIDTYIADEPLGINYIAPQQMPSWLDKLNQIGFGAHIHAIGDGAIRESLNAVEYVRSKGVNRPYTLTHVELVNPQDVPRFAKLDVTADFQVGSDYVAHHDHSWAEPFLGEKRSSLLMNLKAIFDTGANVTLSSDWNVHDINPLVGIANSIKMGATGLPDIDTAIDAYTINAAASLGISDITGSIEVGKSADLAIIDSDITQLPVEEIVYAEVIMTLLQGKTVFDAGDH
ncbi:putative TIM-barrel fold metal-dependent hydrolase [Shewanella psychrophila]|uniref:Putative TIM-barrel fold metal-dependent hydrolase n=1 Tax=Shewanella psychrophila TaxID=225848 RepID=A0A1S6HVD8_9GAMM|nr:amidohydrolase [Shewanella psychrophila]AQS39515.1 putative TIM-barrel fold metal-dependent hydrolase [Shewanella psychrophila]